MGKVVGGFVAAVVSIAVLATAASSHFVRQGLSEFTSIPLGDHVSMTIYDIVHMGPIYAALIAVGLLIAFLVAGGVSKYARGIRTFGFILAGAVAMLAILFLMPIATGGIEPIGGARTAAGIVAQVVAGAIGGWVYTMVNPTRGLA